MSNPEKYLKMGGGGVIIKWPSGNVETIPENGGEGAMVFIFLLLLEIVNTLILFLELMCFLYEKMFESGNVPKWNILDVWLVLATPVI